MFSGSWKESEEHRISLDIPDPNITTEGINKPKIFLMYLLEYYTPVNIVFIQRVSVVHY